MIRVWLFLLALHSLLHAAPPNILLIITDDQGYGDLSVHGNPHLRTPHIDRLASESVRFDRFYVNSFCAPTRAALLTGRWPLRTGCHGVTHNREAMRPAEITLAEALKPAGYRSAYVGKWHNGEQFPFTPQGQGFDEFFGFNNGHWNDYFDATLLRGSKPETTQGYITDVLTDEAMRFISNHQKKPFFCYLSYNAPHSPYQLPDRYYDRFKAMGFDEKLAAFYGMIENMDDNVGRLLAHLEQLKLTDNTLVLFLTDNGGTVGVKTYNAGMRGGKTSVHEGGSRVPLFIRWPAAKWKPRIIETLTSHIDILPTLVDLCEVTPPDARLDGISLKPLLFETGSLPERTLFTHNPISETNQYPGAVRTDRWRLVREIKGPAGGSKATANDESATPWQLYDMQNDPGQEKDVAALHPDVVEELSARYDRWFAEVSSEGLRRLPLPVGHEEHNPVELHAPQAFISTPLHFASGPGFANDWITGWSDKAAQVRFEIDVAAAGDYEVAIAYGSPVPSPVLLQIAGHTIHAELPRAEAREIPLPHRDQEGRTRYRNRDWAIHHAGTVKLQKGMTTLILQAMNLPGPDLKHITLTKR